MYSIHSVVYTFKLYAQTFCRGLLQFFCVQITPSTLYPLLFPPLHHSIPLLPTLSLFLSLFPPPPPPSSLPPPPPPIEVEISSFPFPPLQIIWFPMMVFQGMKRSQYTRQSQRYTSSLQLLASHSPVPVSSSTLYIEIKSNDNIINQ